MTWEPRSRSWAGGASWPGAWAAPETWSASTRRAASPSASASTSCWMLAHSTRWAGWPAGPHTTTAPSKLPARQLVIGTGRVDGRRVIIGGDDFTVRGGAADAAIRQQACATASGLRPRAAAAARPARGRHRRGRQREDLRARQAASYVPANPDWDVSSQLISGAHRRGRPRAGGRSRRGPRRRTPTSRVMVRGSRQVFVAGPPVVKRAFGSAIEQGGARRRRHPRRGNGTVDNEVNSEDEAFEHIRRFLSYMPSKSGTPAAARRRRTTRSAATRSSSPSSREIGGAATRREA